MQELKFSNNFFLSPNDISCIFNTGCKVSNFLTMLIMNKIILETDIYGVTGSFTNLTFSLN